MLGFARFWVSALCLSRGTQAGNSRHDGCCGTSRYIGLFHSFGESFLHARREAITFPRIGLGGIFESDGSTTVHDRLDRGTADYLVGHSGDCI
jgi:hypothetical protein